MTGASKRSARRPRRASSPTSAAAGLGSAIGVADATLHFGAVTAQESERYANMMREAWRAQAGAKLDHNGNLTFGPLALDAEPTEAVKHDAGKVPYHLMSVFALEGLAKVLGFGAKKYTRHGSCLCGAQNANEACMRAAFVETTTTNGSNSRTQPTPQSSETTQAHGSARTRPTERATPLIGRESLPPRSTKSPATSSMPSWPEVAKFVSELTLSASTMTTPPVAFAGASALRAMSDWDGLNLPSGWTRHAPTCRALDIEITGEHNWRKGMAWSRLFRATMAHLFARMRGEVLDPESGLPHIDHAACCLHFLSEYEKLNLGTNDLYNAEPPGGTTWQDR